VSDFEDDLDELSDLSVAPTPTPYHGAETEEILLQLHDIVDAARPVPLSASSMIAKEDVLELIDEALARLPEELRAARWLLKEREEYLARVRHEGDEILDQARNRAERMVQRTEVVKAAENRAYQIMDTAEAEARRLRHEVEDFCDQKLASFEIVLDRTVKLVASGRQKLQGQNLLGDAVEEHPLDLPPPPVAADGDGYDGEDEFFDQDDAS
jgi:vacuolar-type H+-ATPase subunit H